MDERSSLGTVSKRGRFSRNARARNTHVEATFNHSCAAQALAIAGNKADLAERRTVPADDAKAFAADIGALYCETSAKDDTNVSQLFADLVRRAPAGGAARTDDAFDLGHDAAPRRGCCRG